MAELENHKIEIEVLTETRIKSNQQDKAWFNQSKFKQGNCNIFKHKSLEDNRGAGVAIVFRKTWMKCNLNATKPPPWTTPYGNTLKRRSQYIL